MNSGQNIIIGDESALFALLHSDWGIRVSQQSTVTDPLTSCAETLAQLSSFNTDHPLYGGKPVKLLIPAGAQRRSSEGILCRFAPPGLPERSFFLLRERLYMTSPELTFLRMAAFRTEVQLARIATDLCARYYIDAPTGKIEDRAAFLSTPEKLRSYCRALPDIRGSKKALEALRWAHQNSGSPIETQVQLLLTMPLARGGFALPLTHMNYDVKAGRLARIMEQNQYSIDCANPDLGIGIEYDGHDYHQDTAADKRRRNELKALDWDIFPLEGDTLEDPDRMCRFAETVARAMHVRIRRSRAWAAKYLALRKELGLKE